jgi:hypothetical protein
LSALFLALLAAVALIVGIALLSIYLKEEPEDLVGFTRPKPLTVDPNAREEETNEPLTVENLPESVFTTVTSRAKDDTNDHEESYAS